MKYEGQKTVDTINAFTAELHKADVTVKPSAFWSHSSHWHIAVLLGVSERTLYNWQDAYPEVLQAIKEFETVRNARFLELTKKDGAWIFVAKNWLNMRDDRGIEHSGAVKIEPLQVIISDNGAKGKEPKGT